MTKGRPINPAHMNSAARPCDVCGGTIRFRLASGAGGQCMSCALNVDPDMLVYRVRPLQDFSIGACITKAERDRDAALLLLTEIPAQDVEQKTLVTDMLSEAEAALRALNRCVVERPAPRPEHHRPVPVVEAIPYAEQFVASYGVQNYG